MPRSPRARLAGFDRLEPREVPAAGPLADLTTRGADAFAGVPFPNGGSVGVTAGRYTYFLAASAASPAGLFRTDGTPAGTALVKDLAPPAGGYPTGVPLLAAAGDRLVFTADDGTSGVEPWVTDGTAAGTRRLADLTRGPAGTPITNLTTVNGRVVLTTFGPAGPGDASPPRLWATDGTPAGTVRLADLPGGSPAPAAAGGKLYYQAGRYDGAGYVVDLLATDGTPAGTGPLATLPAGLSVAAYDPTAPWAAAGPDGTLVFAGYDGTAGAEPWAVGRDGTAARLLDLNPTGTPVPLPGLPTPVPMPNNGSSPAGFVALNGTVYFAADDGTRGVELWATDGTPAGTRLALDLSPGVGSVDPSNPGYLDPLTGVWRASPNGSGVRNLTAVGGKLYFSADDGGGTGPQLWLSDGTASGTTRLTSLSAPTAGGWYDPAARVVGVAGDRVLFLAASGDRGSQLWATDGTPAGTGPLTSSPPTSPSLYTPGPQVVATAPGKLYFSTDDAARGRQLWATDGTPAGTRLAATVNTATQGSGPRQFTAVGGRGLFVAQTADGTRAALYASDGGAPVVLATHPEAITQVTPAGGKAFAVAGYGAGLLVTDGTAAGTRTLLTVERSVVPSPVPGLPYATAAGVASPTAVGDRLFFTVENTPGTVELWKSDGSVAGTVRVATVRDNRPADGLWGMAATVRQLTAVGDRLYFAVNGGTDDDVVWVSDGTAAGTRRVRDAAPTGLNPDGLTALAGRLYFTATGGDAGRQLWATDGTAAGTRQVAVVNSGARRNDPTPYTYGATGTTLAAGGKLYLPVADEDAGRQLGVYDPATDRVTRLTRTGGPAPGLPPFPGSSVLEAQPQELTAAGDRVYFTAATASGVRQVFVTDGTSAGTRVVRELAGPAGAVSLPAGGGPDILTTIGSRAVFAADDGVHGRELWVTDGTTVGTRLAVEFVPGAAGGLPPGWGEAASAAVVNNSLLLGVTTPATGAEPWAVPLADLGSPLTPTPDPVSASVVRTFAVRGTQRERFAGNLATVTLPEAGGYAATADWGDGRPTPVTLTRGTATGRTWTVSADRVLSLAGDRSVTVRITRSDATVLTATVPASVAEARFYAGRVAQRATAGTSFRGAVAAVDDLGTGMTAADLTASIDWGDGRTTPGTLQRTAAGRLEVIGEHAFAAAGARAVTVTVRGVGSSRVRTAVSTFTVVAAPRVTPAPAADARFYALRVAQRVTAGSPFRGAVAVIDDLGQNLPAAGLTASIHWGDGTTTTGTVRRTAGRLEVVGEHTFATVGRPAVGVTVTAGRRVQVADSLFTVDPVRRG